MDPGVLPYVTSKNSSVNLVLSSFPIFLFFGLWQQIAIALVQIYISLSLPRFQKMQQCQGIYLISLL
jgi:hypothetical protein